MRSIVLLLSLLLTACTSAGSLSVHTDDDDDATGDDDDTPAEDPPRYADCTLEQEFAAPAQNRFEYSIHNFDAAGHNAFSERYFDRNTVQSIDWRTYNDHDDVTLVESSDEDDSFREQTTRWERTYDDLDRQTAVDEYDGDDNLSRSFEVVYEGDDEHAIKTVITLPDGSFDRVQHWTWEGDLLVRQENDLGGDGVVEETLVFEYDGELLETLLMDRNGDGEWDLQRDHEYDGNDNQTRWEMRRLDNDQTVQWSEFAGSCFGE